MRKLFHENRKRIYTVSLLAISTLALSMTFQNCAKSFVSGSSDISASQFPANAPTYGGIPSMGITRLPAASRAVGKDSRLTQSASGGYIKGY